MLYVSQMPAPDEQRLQYSVFLAAYYALFAASRFRPVSAAAQLLPGMALAGLWAPASGGLWGAVAIATAGLWLAQRRGWGSGVLISLAGFWLAYAAFYPEFASRNGVPLAALAAITAAYLLFAGWPAWRAKATSQPLRLPDLLSTVLNAGLYLAAGYGLLQMVSPNYTGAFIAAIAVVQMAQAKALWTNDRRGATLSGGVACVLFVLAAPVQFAGYRVTMVWAAEAAAIAWIGVRLRENRALYGSGVAFGLVLIRLAFIESGLYTNGALFPLMANARLLTFVVSACAFWATAW
jgi:hypothetical protein